MHQASSKGGAGGVGNSNEKKNRGRKGMGAKGGGDIGLGEGEGKTMRREIVPLLLLHESKQADQERERREGKRCGEGGRG